MSDTTTTERRLSESEAACDILMEEISSIKEQIGRAKARAQAYGEYSDSNWYQSANRALRHKQGEHQRLLRETAVIRRQARQAQADAETLTFERTFMRIAKLLLPEDLYQSIIQQTITATGRAL